MEVCEKHEMRRKAYWQNVRDRQIEDLAALSRIFKNKNQSKTGMITKASCRSGLRIETDDGSRETSFD